MFDDKTDNKSQLYQNAHDVEVSKPVKQVAKPL